MLEFAHIMAGGVCAAVKYCEWPSNPSHFMDLDMQLVPEFEYTFPARCLWRDSSGIIHRASAQEGRLLSTASVSLGNLISILADRKPEEDVGPAAMMPAGFFHDGATKPEGAADVGDVEVETEVVEGMTPSERKAYEKRKLKAAQAATLAEMGSEGAGTQRQSLDRTWSIPEQRISTITPIPAIEIIDRIEATH